MDFESYGINALAIIPQSVVLIMSLFSIYAMHIGNYQPPSRVWQGVGGAIYILGFSLYVAFDAIQLDQLGRALMWLGITINFAPRFLITSGDFKWMVKKKGLKETLMQVVNVKGTKPTTK